MFIPLIIIINNIPSYNYYGIPVVSHYSMTYSMTILLLFHDSPIQESMTIPRVYGGYIYTCYGYKPTNMTGGPPHNYGTWP